MSEPGLDDHMLEMLGRIRENSRKMQAQEEAAQTQTVVKLPLWPDSVYGVPNWFLRSALFGAVKRGRRAFQNDVEKATSKRVVIRYTGYQLDQSDLDVWEHCVQLVRKQNLGTHVEFTLSGFLRGIDRAHGSSGVVWLSASLNRLTTAIVTVQVDRINFRGAMISYLRRDEEGKQELGLHPRMIDLYKAGWTQIEWTQRNALRGYPLAQWLHGFYCTHAEPFPLKVSTVLRLSGSENTHLTSFRQKLKDALALLETQLQWHWEIKEGDLLFIHKTPTPSQARHLAKKGKRKPRPQ